MALASAEGHSSFEGYSVGQTLTLRVCSSHAYNLPSSIRVHVSELCTQTLSCTMVVDIVDNGDIPLPAQAFLKMYDHRFSGQLRRDNGNEEWSVDLEKAYIQAVNDGTVAEFLHKLHTIPGFEDDDNEPDWTDVDLEANVDDELFKLFTAEAAAYDALRDQQGKAVPELFATVNTSLNPLDDADGVQGEVNSLEFEPLQVKGILLQYIEGFTLRRMPDHCPRSDWQGIVDQAVEIVRGMENILNRDVRPDNFIVTPLPESPGGQSYRVFMIDFGLCRVRGKDEPIEDWGREKCTKDEDGAAGLVMQLILKRDYGFELEYESVDTWEEWGDTDVSLPEGTEWVEIAPGRWSAIIPGAPAGAPIVPKETGQGQA